MTDARYVIFVGEAMLTAPLKDGDARYFEQHILPNLRPLLDDEYQSGPAVILHTLARFCYVLHGGDVFWCVEWEQGLVVVRFSPDGRLAWTALRSPVPEFGGREPLPEDDRDYDEDAVNHQYSLVFTAWDAQFDADDREDRGFRPADPTEESMYRAAVAHANGLWDQLQARHPDRPTLAAWAERCKENLCVWAGDVVRVR